MEEHLRGDWWYILKKKDNFTSDFLKQCKQNPDVPKDISKDSKYIIKRVDLKGRLYSQVVRIRRCIQNNEFNKKPLVEDEDHNNYNEMNTKKKDGNYMYIDLVKDNDNTHPSKSTKDTKKIKSRRIRTTISFSMTVCKITILVWYWYWLGWWQLYDKWAYLKKTP